MILDLLLQSSVNSCLITNLAENDSAQCGYVSNNVMSAWSWGGVQLMFIITWPLNPIDWISLVLNTSEYKTKPAQSHYLDIVQPAKASWLHVAMWTHLWLTHFMILDGPGCLLVAPSAISFSHSLCLHSIACYYYWMNAGVYLRVWSNTGLGVYTKQLVWKVWIMISFKLEHLNTTFFLNSSAESFWASNWQKFLGALLQPATEKCHMISI